MFFKKKRSRSNPREATSSRKVIGKRFGRMRPRQEGESPWGPGRIPGGKIPYHMKPSVRAKAKAAAAQSE